MSEFTTVASVDDIEAGTGTVIDTGEATIALFNTDGDFYAIGNECTHQGGPLGDGELDDTTVTCPWHGAEFDVTSGDCLALPATNPVPEYEVKVEDGEIRVAL
jgi:nitrite reductase (NADH) small subunit